MLATRWAAVGAWTVVDADRQQLWMVATPAMPPEQADGDPLQLFATCDPASAGRLAAHRAGADDHVVKPDLLRNDV